MIPPRDPPPQHDPRRTGPRADSPTGPRTDGATDPRADGASDPRADGHDPAPSATTSGGTAPEGPAAESPTPARPTTKAATTAPGGADGATGPAPQDTDGGPVHPASTAAAPHPRQHAHDRRMLEALVCPATRAPLAFDPQRGELFSRAAHLAYPIRDGIPIMLASEARETD